MRAIAVPMILLMLSASLAGCTGGDPDGNDESSIDMDILNQMIDDNLQDFINNTSVTVNQEIHYHNNTTVVNNYDETNNEFSNTTNVEGEEVINYNSNNYSISGSNGTNYGGIMYTIDHIFELNDVVSLGSVVTGNRNNTYSYNWSYYDYQTNADRNDTFTFSCNVYYLVGSANSSNQETYWENNNFYEQAWDDQGYNNTIRDMLHTIAGEEDLRFVCDESFNGYWENDQYYYVSIYQITISDGFGFRCYSMDGAPIVYWRDSENNNSWDGGYGASVYYDGVELGCGAPILGGNGEIIIDLYYWINEPFFDKEHRVLFAYELIPVIPLE